VGSGRGRNRHRVALFGVLVLKNDSSLYFTATLPRWRWPAPSWAKRYATR
jgi:hypothetical protein